jgi:hypothetical protein
MVWAAGVSCALGLGFGASASAAPAYGPPTGWPDLAPMAVAPADFPGARVGTQGYVKPDTDTIAEYDRELTGPKVGGQRLVFLEDDVMLFKDVSNADLTVNSLGLGIALAADDLAKSFTKSTGTKVTYTKIGRPTSLGTGHRSSGVVVHLGTRAGEIRVVYAAVRVDSFISFIAFLGTPREPIGLTQAKAIARATVKHIRAGLIPQNTAAPAISGTPEVGQTLSVQAGTWLSAPAMYAYQWQRCDAGGLNCVPVDGATAQTYAVTTADVGYTLAAAVVARNAYGSGTATSAPTAVVAAPPAPTAP